jgi:Zn finger protein HypA/HybF involved in hydrogenase expression
MATKIPVAQKRMFANVFVCKNCRKKIRTQAVRVLAGKVKCPRCDKRAFRAVRKK